MKKKKSNNMVVKISDKMKKTKWLSMEKKLQNEKKHFIIRKYFNLENFVHKEKYKKLFSFAFVYEN